MVLRIYLLMDGKLVPVLRTVPKTTGVARAALDQLIAGPRAAESSATPALRTTVPADTVVLGLSIKDGIATVDLSREFESGGGSASMLGRLGQVVYTLTQFSSVHEVAFKLDGKPVTTFSGEGIVLDHPTGRDDYMALVPPIFVDFPAWGASLANPARITGTANVFEATFRIAIRDGAGNTLADRQVMATCGTGCAGTFDVTIAYAVAKAQMGSLVAYNRSAKDGSVEDLRSYPVMLVP
ncbi:MAG: GerMN domain-containing protein [Chloroflexota bacterium]